MKITIITEELLKDIRTRSNLDVQGMEPEVQYRVEAGSDKNDALRREITTAGSVLTGLLYRFLQEGYRTEADNMPGVAEEMVWVLNVGERRLSGKVQPLTDACHDYLLHSVLDRYYRSVNAAELSKTHFQQTADAAKEIEKLLYSKKPPRYE